MFEVGPPNLREIFDLTRLDYGSAPQTPWGFALLLAVSSISPLATRSLKVEQLVLLRANSRRSPRRQIGTCLSVVGYRALYPVIQPLHCRQILRRHDQPLDDRA